MPKTDDHCGAFCRGCGRRLDGNSYERGGLAYIPENGEPAKVNFYGGWVCSESCDRRASLEMESSFPGAGKARSLQSGSERHVRTNWSNATF